MCACVLIREGTFGCFHTLTSQPAPREGIFPEPSSSPSTLSPWLPGSLEQCQYPWARRAADSKHHIQNQTWPQKSHWSAVPRTTVKHGFIASFSLFSLSLTSNRLSPTSATSRLWPWRWRTIAAFSEAYMQVKSNMATSGWP